MNTDHTEATSSSKSASVGVEASVGTTGNVGVSVKSGMLVISSPQDTASYSSNSESGGFSVSIPVYGAGSFGASANVAGQTVTDTYRSTEATQSGLYAGSGGLDVDVAGNTTLKAGAISSTAESSLNHFHTGALDTTGEDNTSSWSGTSVAAGGGFSTAGSLTDAAKTVTVAVGHVDHDESTTTSTVITGNIGVQTGSSTGSYSTDLTAANGHLENDFNASKVNNTLQTEIGAETAAETAVELGMQAYNRWGPKSQQAGNAGKEQPTSSSLQAENAQSDQPIQTGVQGGNTSPERPDTQLNTVSAHDGSGNTGGTTQEAAVRLGGSVTMAG